MRTSAVLKLCVVLLLSAATPPVTAADLMSIYREAQASDAVYAGARATYAAGQEKLPQGLSGLLPSISASGNSQINDRDLQFRGNLPGFLSGPSRFNSNALSVTATQPLI